MQYSLLTISPNSKTNIILSYSILSNAHIDSNSYTFLILRWLCIVFPSVNST